MTKRALVLWMFASVFVMHSRHVGAQTSAPQYGIQEAEPRTGTNIRRYSVGPSAVPINKRYHQLTAQEKATLNSYYEHMEPGDEPPFPEEGLRPILQAVQKAQGKILASGDLHIQVTVDADGNAIQAKAIGSPDPELTRVVAGILLLAKWKPAKCKGQPCKMDFPFWYSFGVR